MEPIGAPGRQRRMRTKLATPRPRVASALLVAALVLGACSAGTGGGSSSLPSGSPTASAAPTASSAPSSSAPGAGAIKTAEDAFRAVQARSPWFDGLGPKDPQLIGQAGWWEAKPSANGSWQVTVQMGWGDCQAGCIDHHTWLWSVSSDGVVALVSESGPGLPADQQGGAVKPARASGIGGMVVAGPVCPVVRPGETGCDAKPVAGATIVVQNADGKEVARFTTDASGLFRIPLPAGSYTLVAKPVEGLMGTPGPHPVVLAANALATVVLSYDTGIR